MPLADNPTGPTGMTAGSSDFVKVSLVTTSQVMPTIAAAPAISRTTWTRRCPRSSRARPRASGSWPCSTVDQPTAVILPEFTSSRARASTGLKTSIW